MPKNEGRAGRVLSSVCAEKVIVMVSRFSSRASQYNKTGAQKDHGGRFQYRIRDHG